MKDTGIIRRVDELGRIVIPKEIRKTLKIERGDTCEIFVNKGELVLKKYSLPGAKEVSKKIAKILNDLTGKAVIVTDREKVVACSGIKEVKEEKLTENSKKLIKEGEESRQTFKVFIGQAEDSLSQIFCPIKLTNGDVLGGVFMIEFKAGSLNKTHGDLVRFAVKTLVFDAE